MSFLCLFTHNSVAAQLLRNQTPTTKIAILSHYCLSDILQNCTTQTYIILSIANHPFYTQNLFGIEIFSRQVQIKPPFSTWLEQQFRMMLLYNDPLVALLR